MGKPTGFMEYERKPNSSTKPVDRIRNFKEFHQPLSMEERRIQGARCMDCGVPFCQSGMLIGGMASGCPLNNLIPEFNDALYHGNLHQALNRLLKTNLFPEFTSRVCPAPCEAACTCNLNSKPVTIKENEAGIIEYGYDKGFMKAAPPEIRTGKKVAVIGSGPSGLAAAHQLNQRGHQVTVFERSDRIGGLLMYGIPNMKLEKDVIERRKHKMEEEGITFLTGINVGVDKKAQDLIKEYQAIVLACGASNPRDIKVAGRDAKGIYFAVDYLSSITKSLLDSNFTDQKAITARNKHVLIIGGGDTGNDCVGSSIRQGAKSVLQLEMMPQPPVQRAADNPWPEWPKVLKTDYGQEEAIAVFGQDPRVYQTTVKEFIKDKEGKVAKAKLVKLERKADAQTGRITMTEVEKSEYEVEADLVLIAAGFLGSQQYVTDAFGIECNERTNVKTKPGDYATNVNKIFVTGDMHRGQSLVVWAMKEGKECAKQVDEYLMGYSNL